MANEKKGKGKTGGSGNIPPTNNGADNDAVSNQSPKAEVIMNRVAGSVFAALAVKLSLTER